MQKELLEDSWLTSDPIDFEYKKYLLLAYDQKNTNELLLKKIYPNLTDVVNKLMYVNDFLKNLDAFEESTKEFERIDWANQKILYKKRICDDDLEDVKTLALYSKEILSDLYIRYKNFYDEVDTTIEINGGTYSYFDKYSGYLIIKFNGKEKIVDYEIYRTIIPEPTFHLKTSKSNLSEYYSKRYNKNIFEIIVNSNYPAKETTIPLIKNKFLIHMMGGYLL